LAFAIEWSLLLFPLSTSESPKTKIAENNGSLEESYAETAIKSMLHSAKEATSKHSILICFHKIDVSFNFSLAMSLE
jgi:hypothetical protein